VYDGIQEYDNPLPGWWNWLFLLTIIFSVFYVMYFHTGAPGRSAHEMYVHSETEMTKRMLGMFDKDMPQDRPAIALFLREQKWVNYGGALFRTHCQTCHGASGGGLVGPNLADNRWKNVNHIEDIIKIVNQGAGGNAMPAWKQKLDPREIIIVSAYVASLLGSNPANPKTPDGAVTIDSWDEDLKAVPPPTTPDPKATGEVGSTGK
jgi:cytochrome c oxidase cbb3-type subunit 3